ncbi:MAG: glycosyltransferase [Bacteroidetes bacterium]|nr:glycosyltransferase [Bacteroidota bacterium]
MIPGISVVIPTFNRKHLLEEGLPAILSQTILSALYEVIVVSDGSTDGTAGYITLLQKTHSNLKFIQQENSGPAAARNRGASEAKAEILAFTDDDCIPASNWLESILKVFSEKKIIGIQGRTSTYRKLRTPLTQQIDNENGHPAIPTCNAAFLTAAFRQIGGFDITFPFAHNEDADFAWRLEKIGETSFEKSVHVIHPPRKDSFLKIINRSKMLESEFLLFYKDPQAYKTHRNSSPWKTIYFEVFFLHQIRHLKSHVGYFFKPHLMVTGLLIDLCVWVNLILFFPRFIRADKKYRTQFEGSSL